MTNNKIKYFIIYTAIVMFTMLTVKYNYLYKALDDVNAKYAYDVSEAAERVNQRKYLLTALYTIENLIERSDPTYLAGIVRKMPNYLDNDDYKLSMDIMWRYKNLHKLLTTYIIKPTSLSEDYKSSFRSKILLELSAFRVDFEYAVVKSQSDIVTLEKKLQQVVQQKEDVLLNNIMLFIFLLISFYYFIYSVKNDNKVKLNDFAKQTDFNNLMEKYVSDNLVEIEHACQRSNYHNGLIEKQLKQQKELIASIRKDYVTIDEIITKINSFNNNNNNSSQDIKMSFKLYAKALDTNKKIESDLDNISQENEIIGQQLLKNKKYIKSIFYSSQKISVNMDKRKKQENKIKTRKVVYS